MADRYWVPGSTNWNQASSWATTLGGAGGAGVPTSADNAIFGNNITYPEFVLVSNATCANLTIDGNTADVGSLYLLIDTLTVAGTFSNANSAGNRRVVMSGSYVSLAFTPLCCRFSLASLGSISDVDFEGIYVVGGAVTNITGTRLGDLGRNIGITFPAPKTVYYVGGSGNWSGNQWAASSGGAASTDNFPLPQDTAIIDDNSGAASTTITFNDDIQYFGNFDASQRTTALTFDLAFAIAANSLWNPRFTGNIIRSSSVTFANSTANQTILAYTGEGTSVIISSGGSWFSNKNLNIYTGTLKFGDAFNAVTNLFIQGGTLDTQGYSVAIANLSSLTTRPKNIYLRSSTVTFSGISGINLGDLYDPTSYFYSLSALSLNFDAGTSTLVFAYNYTSSFTVALAGRTFYNVSFTGAWTAGITATFTGANSVISNNLTFSGFVATGTATIAFTPYVNPLVIGGTLSANGSSPTSRYFITNDAQGSVLTTQTVLNVGALSATDCDFRYVTITGSAAGSSPTRAGDCGFNSGITFPAPKTVYWNLAGVQNWSANGWASSSGGSPSVNNFPLAQDTAIFDNVGSAGTVSINAYFQAGTVDMSGRTSAMTFSTAASLYVRGDWKLGTGITVTTSGFAVVFQPKDTTPKNLISNGVSHGLPIVINALGGTIQLGDSISVTGASTNIFYMRSGTFDAVSYNVTVIAFITNYSNTRIIKMGSGLWTMTGTGTVWDAATVTGLTFYPGTANITLSDTSTTARTFAGGGLRYNKLTIGGSSGVSTLTISGNNTFSELASTKLVAHTIALGTTVQTFGAWTVTGSLGNVVTLTGTGVSHVLKGPCTSGVNYLAMGSIGFANTSLGEFYAGVNSTGTAGAPVYRTAKPADSTRYWVGGTGNWSSTTKWSTSSGGASGASVPRSHDDVVFNSASSAVAYTATVDAVTGGNRCKSLTISGPASGNVTLAGTTRLMVHGSITLPATGMTNSFTGNIDLAGTAANTLTTNGVALGSPVTIAGINSNWTLGSALNLGANGLTLGEGTLDLSTYGLTAGLITSLTSVNAPTFKMGSGTITLSSTTPWTVTGYLYSVQSNTSQLTMTGAATIFSGNSIAGTTFYNVSFTSTAPATLSMTGPNTFNNLTFSGLTSSGNRIVQLGSNTTVTGTLTFSAGTDPTMRHFLKSDVLGTARTITLGAFTGSNVDFQDITVSGAAAPISGTSIGDVKGNSGITFTAPKTVWWNQPAGGAWTSAAWATSSGGSASTANFPLAQDTTTFDNTGLSAGSSITFSALANIGTVDMSAVTVANTFNLGSFTHNICGDWKNGVQTSLTIASTLYQWSFVGRGSQTISTNGMPVAAMLDINSPGGTVSLLDALTNTVVNSSTSSGAIRVIAGTFNSNGYNITLPSGTLYLSYAITSTRGVNFGASNISLGASVAFVSGFVNCTITGNGVFNCTRTLSQTIYGGNTPNMTLNLGGSSGANNQYGSVYYNVTSTRVGIGAAFLGLSVSTAGNTIRVKNFSAKGSSAGNLSLTGYSRAAPGSLILDSGGVIDTDYISTNYVCFGPAKNTWYVNSNSSITNAYGFVFGRGPIGNFLMMFGA